jgi:subtilisin family serine protease
MKKRRVRSRSKRSSNNQSEARRSVAAQSESGFDQTDPNKPRFNPETLDGTVIAIPLLRDLKIDQLQKTNKLYAIIVDLNLQFPGGRNKAREYVEIKVKTILQERKTSRSRVSIEQTAEGIRTKGGVTERGPEEGGVEQYLFARLSGNAIRRLVIEDGREDDTLKKDYLNRAPFARAIYRVWPDFPVHRLINKSVSTVKADAARASFAALGEGIVWAVLDSGIDANHRHFKLHRNLALDPPLEPMDFTGGGNVQSDPCGHGTHVAGIIAGEVASGSANDGNKGPRQRGARARSANAIPISAAVRHRSENGDTVYSEIRLSTISGMAPKCKLLNMRILDKEGNGEVSSIIAAISKIQAINGYGRRLLIHGVNISIGNDFEPEWFACGQSPLCVEVDRLVKSGVVVVVAAGNSGYGSLKSEFTGTINTGMSLTVNDPGNAELAITVGSTHREMPHVYGVSYFSSKGPTGDGRQKPDLVAPGEKIISCAAGNALKEASFKYEYVEDSGTSMAAPHVSGVIAAFLSVRREFIGQPERVKEIFLSTTTNLHRERYFQGTGLVDLMRAIQSV